MRHMWRSKSFLTALSSKACLGREAVAFVVFIASCLKSVFASSCFRSDVGHQGDMAYLPVTVYRGLGGCHICIMDCRTLTTVLAAVDARTDWLWGVGHSYVVVDMDFSELLGWEHLYLSHGRYIFELGPSSSDHLSAVPDHESGILLSLLLWICILGHKLVYSV